MRLDRWRYLTEVRARTCAEQLIPDEAQQKQVVFDLIAMAGGPPDPKIKPRLQQALDRYAPALAERAQANPVIRANALMLSARYGIREEMKQAYGFAWRDHVRGVTTTFDASDNLALRAQGGGAPRRARREIRSHDRPRLHARSRQGHATSARAPASSSPPPTPNGEIVRYFEQGETASYFGSPFARDAATGFYDAGARKPHGRLHGQDHRGHRHRQHRARYARRRSISTARRPRNRAGGVRTRDGAARTHRARHALPARSTIHCCCARRASARRGSPS